MSFYFHCVLLQDIEYRFLCYTVGPCCCFLKLIYLFYLEDSSVQFSHSVMSNSLRPHESQHARPPCPSLTPEVYPNSCPSSRWCHPAISSSVVPFSSCPQSLPASGSFPMSQLFSWGGPKYWSFSFSISPSNEHPGLISFRIDWLDLLAVQGTLKSLLQHHSSKASIVWPSAFFPVQLSHPYMTRGKTFKGQLFLFHQNLNWVSHEFWSLPTQLLALWQKTTSHEYLYLIFGKFHRFNP